MNLQIIFSYVATGLCVQRRVAGSSGAVVAAAFWEGESVTL
jgi:hypothetical protein